MNERSLIIVIPAYNDWHALSLLLQSAGIELAKVGKVASVLIVDDASTTPAPADLFISAHPAIEVQVLRLKANLGHQRAIAIGLSYIHDHLRCQRVLVMDADGEDRPQDLPALLQASSAEGDGAVIFAERAKRSEPMSFRLGYACYRWLFRLFTGQAIRFGNFSVIPASLLSRIVCLADLWNNYPAAVIKARFPLSTVACNRGTRLSGSSKMNLIRLILHGLSAISVYNEIFGARALIASISVMLIALMLGVTAVVIRFTTNLAIPGWATYAVGLSVLAILQALSLTAFFVFLILHSRSANVFVPGRDYAYYVAELVAG